jgi:3-hydroxyisobutyrate dehydrogenase-like beta-hydroxyacid dehydrogenase
MSESQTTVAMLGLGRMGSAIARNIARGPFDLRVYNRTAAKAEPFRELGATVASDLAEAVDGADVVVSCLMDDRSLLDTVGGTDGIAAAMAPGAVHVGTTTISPGVATEAARLHAAAGNHYVAGPVVGRPDAAEAGTLLTIVAGQPEALTRARSVLDAYTHSVLPVGAEHAAANYLKLGVNYFAISFIELTSQLYAFSEKNGVGVETMSHVIPKLLHNPAFVKYAGTVAAREFQPAGFALTGGIKDVELMRAASAEVGAPLLYGDIVHRKMQTALEQGRGEDDWSVIYEIARAEAGLS